MKKRTLFIFLAIILIETVPLFAQISHGIVAVSPDTDTIPHNINGVNQPRAYEYCAGYQYKDSSIVGFSHTHFSGTGHSDLGDILLMPFTGQVQVNPGTATDPDSGYRSRFSHKTEKSRPGYYEVMLSDDQIKVQLTATERAGIHKYTYPSSSKRQVLLDLNHGEIQNICTTSILYMDQISLCCTITINNGSLCS